MHGLSLVAASSGFSYCGAWALGVQASVVVARGLSCSAACAIFPDQGSNPCPLHWQADSQPLHHQGSSCFHLCLEEIVHSLSTRFKSKPPFLPCSQIPNSPSWRPPLILVACVSFQNVHLFTCFYLRTNVSSLPWLGSLGDSMWDGIKKATHHA